MCRSSSIPSILRLFLQREHPMDWIPAGTSPVHRHCQDGSPPATVPSSSQKRDDGLGLSCVVWKGGIAWWRSDLKSWL
ncbi:hypothetical protein J1605_013964 [Eschrichtius robustus]|uniref:Uncharacterized protein n=1 Tax=Eschrichtius robustus TaxID=9764 RepID=A0AB34GF76_ESCRO|nr:hypothetical protein J1605_013964 [Eschrichtius robustus]